MRIIQDSDDEFEEDLEAEIAPKEAANAPLAQQEHGGGDASAAGTGSTGMMPPPIRSLGLRPNSRVAEKGI